MGHTTDVVRTVQAESGDRRAQVAQAALEVLEAEGGRGLTHRAVDRRAALAEGSTSNYYPSREALLTAALQRLVELERPGVRAMEDLAPGGPYEPWRAAELVAGLVQDWLAPDRFGLTVARYELILEARRRPEFQLALNEVRREYRLLAERCSPPPDAATRGTRPAPLAVLDGLMVNQLFEPATALSEAEIVEHLARFFAILLTCPLAQLSISQLAVRRRDDNDPQGGHLMQYILLIYSNNAMDSSASSPRRSRTQFWASTSRSPGARSDRRRPAAAADDGDDRAGR